MTKWVSHEGWQGHVLELFAPRPVTLEGGVCLFTGLARRLKELGYPEGEINVTLKNKNGV